MKKQTYELIPALIRQFSNSLKTKEDLLQKSKEEGSLSAHIGDVVNEHHRKEDLSKSLNSAFEDLQDDFLKGRINLVYYRNCLKPLKEFFKSGALLNLI